MKRLLCSIFTLLILTGVASAQQVTVTGTVTDEHGPLVGASVILQGTTTGRTVDAEGNFSIPVPNPQRAVLEFKFVGYNDVSYPLNGKTSGIDIKMVEFANQLDDVVVIGYGTSRRGDLTGSVASVSAATIAKVPVASAAEALKGKMAGVQVTQADGSPDAEIMIRVRGGGSITQDNSPLLVVDGFIVSNLNDVPPTDIESIDVLKDASSTAIYGARGANGVVIVTTKQARAGTVSVNVNAYLQWRTLYKKLDVMDPYEFVLSQYEYDRVRSSDVSGFISEFGDPKDLYIYKGLKGTDWQDEAMGGTKLTRYVNASIRGGTEKTSYNFSYTNTNEEGILIGNGFDRTNFNVKIRTQLAKNVNVEYSTRFTNTRTDGAGTGGASVLSSLEYRPTEGLIDFMELPPPSPNYDPEEEEEVQRFAPSEDAAKNYRRRKNWVSNTTAALNWTILPKLIYRAEFGIDQNVYQEHRFYGPGTGKSDQYGSGLPIAEITDRKRPKWRMSNTLTYMFDIKDHSFNVMAGQEALQNEDLLQYHSARYFPIDISPQRAFDNMAQGEPYEVKATTNAPDRLASFFGRINYNWKSRYMATVTLRADGSTKFAPGRQWGYFPAGAVAWRISEEPFMASVKHSLKLSNLKLRLSFGAAGNNRIDDDMWRSVYSIQNSKMPGWNEENHPYYALSSSYLTNPILKWETTYTRNLGIDFGFWDERINGVIDVYWNTTKDLLVPSDISGFAGFTKQQTNVGQTSNRGVELTLNAFLVQKKDWGIDLNFNIGYNQNRIDKLASGEEVWLHKSGWASTDLLQQEDYRMIVGETMGLIFGYVNDGFYTVDEFDFNPSNSSYTLKPGIANSTQLSGTPRPGNSKFKKLTPVDENEPESSRWLVTEADRQIIGDTNPKFSGGFNVNARYKGFDLTLYFNFMYGFDVYNGNKMHQVSYWRNSRNNLIMDVGSENRFRYFDDMGNDLRPYPDQLAAFNKNATMWNPTSMGKPIVMSYIIEDGSFLRLNNIQLGYTLPARFSQKVGIKNLRVYVTGYNVYNWTNYSGYDPEVNVQKGLNPGIDNNVYPRSRSYTVGLNITF